MSYIKNSLPDDWEPDPSKYQSPKNYLCIGNKEIQAKWLPRWYKVPYQECLFAGEFRKFSTRYAKQNHLIELTYRPDGDYTEHLKILKTEHLLNGRN